MKICRVKTQELIYVRFCCLLSQYCQVLTSTRALTSEIKPKSVKQSKNGNKLHVLFIMNHPIRLHASHVTLNNIYHPYRQTQIEINSN